ncbi:MAG: prephenate dehydrogenase/arogenate dehydrogenase family protein [Chloroflexi bacterium]|nr:prephenate dehydrogenase/arogenate dehydrogenase family protein [Chloroflexota bacterium]
MARRVTIIGVGLIGGSMGLALRPSRSRDTRVIGFVRRPSAAGKLLGKGIVDAVETSLSSAVSGSDTVILATPVMAIKDVLAEIAPYLSPGCLVTDVASTKAQVMQWASEHLPTTVDFVGGHPMAGKELSGADAADANLFRGCTYCLVPGRKASSAAVERMMDLAREVGAKPLLTDASEHDECVAGISHLPFVISSALVAATTGSPSWPMMSRLAATGYRDVSRLASQHPEMERDICLTNRDNIVAWLDDFTKELTRFRQLVADGAGEGLEQAFDQARQARQRWLEDHAERD